MGDTAPTFDQAVAGLRAAIAYGLETGSLFPAALASGGLGCTLFRRHGVSPEAVAALEQAVELAVRAGVPHIEQRDRRILTEVLAASGEVAAARSVIEQVVARCDVAAGEQAAQDLLSARARLGLPGGVACRRARGSAGAVRADVRFERDAAR